MKRTLASVLAATLLAGCPNPGTETHSTTWAESDYDRDGKPNGEDNCPDVANDQHDEDGDGFGDLCDDCPSDERIAIRDEFTEACRPPQPDAGNSATVSSSSSASSGSSSSAASLSSSTSSTVSGSSSSGTSSSSSGSLPLEITFMRAESTPETRTVEVPALAVMLDFYATNSAAVDAQLDGFAVDGEGVYAATDVVRICLTLANATTCVDSSLSQEYTPFNIPFSPFTVPAQSSVTFRLSLQLSATANAGDTFAVQIADATSFIVRNGDGQRFTPRIIGELKSNPITIHRALPDAGIQSDDAGVPDAAVAPDAGTQSDVYVTVTSERTLGGTAQNPTMILHTGTDNPGIDIDVGAIRLVQSDYTAGVLRLESVHFIQNGTIRGADTTSQSLWNSVGDPLEYRRSDADGSGSLFFGEGGGIADRPSRLSPDNQVFRIRVSFDPGAPLWRTTNFVVPTLDAIVIRNINTGERVEVRLGPTDTLPLGDDDLNSNWGELGDYVITQGSLFKGSLTAVYYMAGDGKRYVFPNEYTFASWYSDFQSVITVSDQQLATIMIGGNVTIHPGTYMVKIQSDPGTYAVEFNGVLRRIVSEQVAVELYGSDWNQYVIDIPDAFFVNYTIGTDIFSLADYNPVDRVDRATIECNVRFTVGCPIAP